MVLLVQEFESSLLVMVQLTEVWMVIRERGVSNVATYFEASLCGQFIVIIY